MSVVRLTPLSGDFLGAKSLLWRCQFIAALKSASCMESHSGRKYYVWDTSGMTTKTFYLAGAARVSRDYAKPADFPPSFRGGEGVTLVKNYRIHYSKDKLFLDVKLGERYQPSKCGDVFWMYTQPPFLTATIELRLKTHSSATFTESKGNFANITVWYFTFKHLQTFIFLVLELYPIIINVLLVLPPLLRNRWIKWNKQMDLELHFSFR